MSTVAANTFTDANNAGNATFRGYLNTPGGAMFRNRIINGDMRIDQRNAGASITPSSDTYTLDRWQYQASQSSKFAIQQNRGSVSRPAGFSHYLGMATASAVSIGSSDYFVLLQRIEGFNAADFAWGTSSAQAVTLSFWVYSSLTGTFGGAIRNGATDRSYAFTYTVNSANTWEQKTVTIAGDTSGTWTTDNTTWASVIFGLGVGSSLSATAGSWGAGNKLSATGAVSVVGTNGATFYITGVQLEAGTVANPVFERRDYGMELRMCQRYYELAGSGLTGGARASTTQTLFWPFKVTKRATPTVSLLSTVNLTIAGTGNYSCTAIAGGVSGTETFSINVTTTAGAPTNGLAIFAEGSSGVNYFSASAEL